ncbi:hypothetical protein KHA90_23910 [Flavobacterium psychroterrae]|uniref:Uncharacterized protein n=1 Tax=Flavobacterium psychroterrae TaxID=2133767 RepID=A0ABS5PIC4_9FLAO|nr:hypothetical protein [Flavobacterium psychroterrae]MBS7234054.1 hypothetical protein [Flavobacterium psychroterrae]
MEKSIFILKTINKSFYLKQGQSPRGLREEHHRPYLITVEVDKTMDQAELSKFIEYLIELKMAMTYGNP